MDKQLLESTVSKVLDEMRLRPIPLGFQIVISTCQRRIMNACFLAIPSARKKRCCSRDSTLRSKPSPW